MKEKCSVCGNYSEEIEKKSSRECYTKCTRCGIFKLLQEEYQIVSKLDLTKKMALSHWIRKQNMSGHEPDFSEPIYDDCFFNNLTSSNPAQQADNLIEYLGNNQISLSGYVSFMDDKRLHICAIIGFIDDLDLKFVIIHLFNKGLLSGLSRDYDKYADKDFFIANNHFRLTFDGWQRYEDLKKIVKDSKQVFMAMKFIKDENEPTEILYKKFLKEAVDKTGLKLVRLDEVGKAGLIDNNMRVEITKSCMLLSELTHDNNGAYFEAGYAEGMNIPVIYLCEKEKFDVKKTHFDTNHCTTIIWEKGKEAEAMEKLKATIRITIPDKAKMEDE